MPADYRYVSPAILERARELRQPQTPAERRLWECLRDSRLAGYKFRRQHPIDRFIVDFYCAASRLIVEVDGESHVAQEEYDAARTEWLEAHGYRVIRFTNLEVHQQLEGVVTTILQACQAAPADRTRRHSPSP
jgi:very-short-patch-repair endonuclease